MEACENNTEWECGYIDGYFTTSDLKLASMVNFMDEEACRGWVINKLHGDKPLCPSCFSYIRERALVGYLEGRRIFCDKCGKYFTATTDTFISGTHMDFRSVVLLCLLLDLGVTDRRISELIGISAESVRLWRLKFKSIEDIRKTGA